ncbi:MAG: hypothetical protein JW891_07395 [Candidatus Lokiarchaeota archaeon]|nr:hypothetical protein [Candidatus Lokiarchaeota archaeon]
MNEKDTEKLEKELLEYLKTRRSLRRSIKNAFGFTFVNHTNIVVKTFVNCLNNLSDEVYIKDLVITTVADYYDQGEAEISSYAKKPSKLKPLLETLFHLWFLYLQKNDKLPSGTTYNRYAGKYKKL